MFYILFLKDYSVYAIHRIKFIPWYHSCNSAPVCFLTSFGILNLSLYFLLSFIHIFLQIDMLNIVHLHKTIKTLYNISPKQAEYLKNFIVQFNFHVNKISCIYPLKSYKIPYEDNLSLASSTCIFNSIITTKPTKLHNKMQYVTLWFRQLQVKSIYPGMHHSNEIAHSSQQYYKYIPVLQMYTVMYHVLQTMCMYLMCQLC